MFLVICTYEMGDTDWEAMDRKLYKAAGDRRSDGNSTTYEKGVGKIRRHEWKVRGFQTARRIKEELNKLDGVKATLREV